MNIAHCSSFTPSSALIFRQIGITTVEALSRMTVPALIEKLEEMTASQIHNVLAGMQNIGGKKEGIRPCMPSDLIAFAVDNIQAARAELRRSIAS